MYCQTRRKVEETADWLVEQGITALPYHAGMESAARSANQLRFQRDDGVVMVATVAFGMGIDKPDVRFVAHMDLPKSLEGYYQETGRAGRDGMRAEAWMCFGLGDVVALNQFIAQSESGEERKRVERAKLEALLGYAETTGCRRKRLLAYFGESIDGACGNCDNCLEPPASIDGTQIAQKALSCVYRTGQRFGMRHLIAVLRGEDDERVRSLGHAALSVYGIGKDLDERQWRSVFRQLVAAGLLMTDDEGFGVLSLAPPSKPILRGEATINLRKPADKKERRRKTQRGNAQKPSLEIAPHETGRWDQLRATRARLAREQGVPAYVIFHDATLVQMLRDRPQTLDELTKISGVGAAKLTKYGEAFLAALRSEG